MGAVKGPNPKVSTLPLLVVALAAVHFGTVMVGVLELAATGGPRLDRGLRSFVIVGLLWGAVVAVDLVLHPRMRMTRMILGTPFRCAFFYALVSGAGAFLFDLFGESLSNPANRVASAGFSFVVVWALASLWGLLREWRSPTSAHSDTEHGALV